MMNMLLSDSDWESYSLSSDSEDQDNEFSYGGHAQSILSSLAESIGKIDNFLSFERGFVHGDIVCSISDPSGQMGRVVGVEMMVDLETMSGVIIRDVDTKELLKFLSFATGDYVIHGPWLGRVSRVVDVITILFDDGAKCEITADPETLLPISPNVLADSQYPYYPGQRVQIRLPTVLKSAKWLCGTWKANRKEGLVCHVEVGSVYVDWVASVLIGCNFSFPTPAHLQDPKSLTLLSCFPSANWQLGDWCILPYSIYKDHYKGVKDNFSPRIGTQGGIMASKKFGGPQGKDRDCENIFVIVKTKTKVDVMWQDGNLKLGLDSQSLVPVDNVGDHDFWPEQFVLEKGTYNNVHVSTGQRLGIVKSVDAIERTVKVKWMTPDQNQTVDEETVSAYELIEHPDYAFCLGDVVFRFLPDSKNLEASLPVILTEGHNQRYEEKHVMKMEMALLQPLKKDVLEEKHISEGHYEYSKGYLSCIGNVISYQDGAIEVKWASGLISKVEPHEIFGIDRYEDLASAAAIYEQDIEDNVCQVILDGDKSLEEKDKDELEKAVGSDGEDSRQDWWDASVLLFPRAAFGFLTSVATSLFCSRGSTSLLGPTQSNSSDRSKNCHPDLVRTDSKDANKFGILPFEPPSDCQIVKAKEPLSDAKDLQILRQTILKKDIQMIKQIKEVSLGSEKPGQFNQFDIVDDYSDHHFVNGTGKGSMLSQLKRTWLKKVQQEWCLLEKDLPDTIYVRVYEERIDLMRAAVIGAPGTPYHDGLFFFDIFLPPDYPFEPPLVYYNSGGLKLNPNLYESGRICLSLLNTWTGTGNEVWNPESSTILQVLLSLQALVLNEKPYFNEAGYDKQIGRIEGEKNSTTYNENAFLLSVKSMLYVLSKPPKNFEALIEEHFSHCSCSILLACKAYMNGAQVGCAFEYGDFVGESHKSCSMGFKIMLSKLFPKLISAFTEKGIECHQFLEQENEVPKPG